MRRLSPASTPSPYGWPSASGDPDSSPARACAYDDVNVSGRENAHITIDNGPAPQERRWRDGVIPDLKYAISPLARVSDDRGVGQRLLGLVPLVPTPVWGRDELRAGEMWNSNSIAAWLLARAGVDAETITLPPSGLARGWDAGVAVAQRHEPEPQSIRSSALAT